MTTDGPGFSAGALAEYRDLLGRYPTRRAALMPTLWIAQREFGWLSLPVLEYVARLMELPLAWVTSVASFYTMYWKEPKGRWHLQVCRNLSCQLRGAEEVQRAIESRLGIRDGGRSADERFSLEEVECLASCDTGPVVQVNNEEYHERLDVARALALVDRLARK